MGKGITEYRLLDVNRLKGYYEIFQTKGNRDEKGIERYDIV